MDSVKKNPSHRFRSKGVVFFACYIIIVLFVGLIHWGVIFSFPHHEIVESTSVTSWVPIYILYNPPGETSYCACYANYTHVSLKLEGSVDDLSINSELSIGMDTASFGTSYGVPETYALYALYLNMTWNLWRYTDGSNVWFEAKLVNCLYNGWGTFSSEVPSMMSSRGLLVHDMTGEESSNTLTWNVGANATDEIAIEWAPHEFASLGLGCKISLFDYEIALNVSILPENYIVNRYVLGNDADPLTVQMMSNGRFYELADGNDYRTIGALVWFSYY